MENQCKQKDTPPVHFDVSAILDFFVIIRLKDS